jgi:hypothetical protein
MEVSPLTDRDFNLRDMPFIREAEVVESDSLLRVKLLHGLAYQIPVAYLRQWYEGGPHQILPEHGALEATIIEEGDMLRVRLPDGSVYLVAWDVILMACEPRYVHFGGFTEYSKRTTQKWFDAHGPLGL